MHNEQWKVAYCSLCIVHSALISYWHKSKILSNAMRNDYRARVSSRGSVPPGLAFVGRGAFLFEHRACAKEPDARSCVLSQTRDLITVGEINYRSLKLPPDAKIETAGRFVCVPPRILPLFDLTYNQSAPFTLHPADALCAPIPTTTACATTRRRNR